MEVLVLLKVSPQQLSMYSVLYDKIPNTHILKRISSSVDFSFINPLLEGSYCKHFGRPAKEPEMMAKLLILQYLYDLSDVRIIDESRLNLAYMWFLGINPEEGLPEASLLTKFRKHRLKETSVDDIIQEVVRKSILDILKNDSVEAIIPVNASVFRIDDNRFHYNKDSEQ
jgi:transposase